MDAFRSEFRRWLRNALPDGWVEAVEAGDESGLQSLRSSWDRQGFLEDLGEAGYAAPTWPGEHGGLGADSGAVRIVAEELAALRLPTVSPNLIGIGMAGPTIIDHGTLEQQRRFLPPMLRCREIWCQLFSEPSAGSDLAGLATRAVRDGDHYVVTGQKVWSSLAHTADLGMLLARTDPTVPKHAGLAWFVLDMAQPEVEVRPLRQMSGDAEFNEVFLDEARVPASHLVGGEGNGWAVAKTTLRHERDALAAAEVGGRAARLPDAHGRHRDQALRRRVDATIAAYLRDRPNLEGPVARLASAELNQRMTDTELDVLGPSGMLDEGESLEAVYRFLRARANTIEGGTSEILRNILGERVLDLPREPRVDLDIPWEDLPRDGKP